MTVSISVLVIGLWSFLCSSKVKREETVHNTELGHRGLLAEIVSRSYRSVGGGGDFEIQIEF